MQCYECGSKTGVKESFDYYGTTIRRHKCKTCGLTFYTEEITLEDKDAISTAIKHKNYKYYVQRRNK